MSVRRELDALYRAKIERIPLWNEVKSRGGLAGLPVEQALVFMLDLLTVESEVTLALADHVDHLLDRLERGDEAA